MLFLLRFGSYSTKQRETSTAACAHQFLSGCLRLFLVTRNIAIIQTCLGGLESVYSGYSNNSQSTTTICATPYDICIFTTHSLHPPQKNNNKGTLHNYYNIFFIKLQVLYQKKCKNDVFLLYFHTKKERSSKIARSFFCLCYMSRELLTYFRSYKTKKRYRHWGFAISLEPFFLLRSKRCSIRDDRWKVGM